MKSFLALLLVMVLLLAICGCGAPESVKGVVTPVETSPAETPFAAEEERPKETPPVGNDYFTDVWRGDLDYSDMVYEHYEAAWFEEYTAPIYELAENGGTAEEFSDADYYLWDELNYVYLMMQLADLAYCADPTDEEWSYEYAYIQELYYELYDEYWLAMRALATSANAGLLKAAYPDHVIERFATYEESDGGDTALYGRENELLNEYYSLMSETVIDYNAVGEVYVKLVEVRRQLADYCGYESYADYAYDSLYYKDYLPEDAHQVWEGVKTYFVPLMKTYSEKAMQGAALLEAAELDCSEEAVLAVLGDVLPQISGELSEAYEYMMDHGLYDISYDTAKMETGFTTSLYYLNQPFIFNSPYGLFYDYLDMIHEFGHFANYYYTAPDLLFGMPDNDLVELQSQGMEMLFTRYYGDIFGEYAEEAEGYVLLSMIYSIVDGALYDEFQQRVYAEEELTLEKVNEIYAELYVEYGYETYRGYETEWMDVIHNFDYPFYYISYCVSALGALEIYELSQSDWPAAVDKYLTVCAMDPEAYYYAEALVEAGFADVFDAGTYETISQAAARGLEG